MDSSPAQLLAQEYTRPLDSAPLSEWTGATSDSHSSTSSPGSYNWSPADEFTMSSNKIFHSCLRQQARNLSLEQTGDTLHGNRRTRCRMAGNQRHSASEREKLRMRNLSKAVQNLRKYLPPSVVPARQNLTKIDTLRLAIRYISHLTALLGLSEGALAQRRQEELQRYSLCLKSQDCFQEGLHLASTAKEHSTFYLSSPECSMTATTPVQPQCQVQDNRAWLSSPQSCEAGSPPVQQHSQYMNTDSWVTSPASSSTMLPPAQQDAGLMDTDSWLSSSLCSKLAHFYHYQMVGSPSLDPMPSTQSTPKHNDPARMVRDPRRSSANSMLAGLSMPCLR